MLDGIKWNSGKVKISALKDYEHNPRRMSKKDFERLVNDIKQDGYRNRIIANADLTILGGHSRKKALLAAGYNQSDEIEVLLPNRQLTTEELKRINIRDNLPFGEYDFDILANHFDPVDLLEWGMPAEWLVNTDDFKAVEETDKDRLDKKVPIECPECGHEFEN